MERKADQGGSHFYFLAQSVQLPQEKSMPVAQVVIYWSLIFLASLVSYMLNEGLLFLAREDKFLKLCLPISSPDSYTYDTPKEVATKFISSLTEVAESADPDKIVGEFS